MKNKLPNVDTLYILPDMYKSKIAKWGNSLAIRLPANVAEEFGVEENAEISIEAKKNLLILKKTIQVPGTISMKMLLKGFDADKLDTEDPFEGLVSIGKEVW